MKMVASKAQDLITQIFDDISLDIINIESENSWYKFYLKQQKNRIKKDLSIVVDLYQKNNSIKNNFKILDVGSNPPFLISVLSKNGFDVTGIDYNPQNFAKTIDKSRHTRPLEYL